jgi:hypothetical protein
MTLSRCIANTAEELGRLTRESCRQRYVPQPTGAGTDAPNSGL